MQFTLVIVAALAGLAAAAPANVVKQKVVYSSAGERNVVGNGFGCADIYVKDKPTQLGCVKHIFADGFTVRITDLSTKKATLCSIKGAEGVCGPNGISVKVDLTGGTGKVPTASGPGGTKSLTQAQLQNKPIR